jgi:hypothetical protein
LVFLRPLEKHQSVVLILLVVQSFKWTDDVMMEVCSIIGHLSILKTTIIELTRKLVTNHTCDISAW